MKTLVWVAMCAVSLAGCFGVVASDRFTYRGPIELSGQTLRLDGYYFSADTRGPSDDDSYLRYTGTLIRTLVLWEDGTAASLLHMESGQALSQSDISPTRYGTVRDAQETFERQMPTLLTGERSDPAHWGAFRLRGDSISIQVLHWGMSGSPGQYFPVEYNGVVLDDTTLVLTEVIHPVTHTLGDEGVHATNDTLRFKRVEDKPRPENWTQTHPRLQP